MLNQKLIKTLKNLSQNDQLLFMDFLKSPFFNKNNTLVAYYQYFLDCAPHFDNDDLGNLSHFKALSLTDSSIISLSKILLKKLDIFIQYANLQLEDLSLLDNKILSLLKTKQTKHAKEHLQKYLLDYSAAIHGAKLIEVIDLYLEHTSESDDTSDFNQSLKNKKIKTLDQYYFFQKLRLSNRLLIENYELNKELIHELETKFFPFVKLISPNQSDEYTIEEHVYRLYFKEDEDKFTLVSQAISSHLISESLKREYAKILINYCIRKIIQGKEVYYEQLLNTYALCIKKALFLENGMLSPMRLKNILVASVKSNNYFFGKQILEEYCQFVPTDYRNAVNFYGLAYLEFHQNNFDKALDLLDNCINQQNYFKLDAEIIKYKIYYITNQDWAFDSPLLALKSRLKRMKKEHPPNLISAYINFIEFVKKIYIIKTHPDPSSKIQNLNSKITNTKLLSDKAWLLEILQELN